MIANNMPIHIDGGVWLHQTSGYRTSYCGSDGGTGRSPHTNRHKIITKLDGLLLSKMITAY